MGNEQTDVLTALERLGNDAAVGISALVSAENRANAAAGYLRSRAAELLIEAAGLEADAENARLEHQRLKVSLDQAVVAFHAANKHL